MIAKILLVLGLLSIVISVLVLEMANAQPDDFNYDEARVPKYTLPKMFGTSATADVVSAETWEQVRRAKVLGLFQEHVYGQPFPEGIEIEYRVVETKPDALGGLAVRKQVKMVCTRNGRKHEIDLLIYLPAAAKDPVPLFVGLNFYGNQTVTAEPEVLLPTSWVRNKSEWGITDNRAVDLSRGKRNSRWPIETIVGRGYGVATIYYGDIDPDFDDGFRNGIHSLFGKDELDSDKLTSISAWSWGLSRALDYFATDEHVDASRVAVIGHSRLGKTSLWAGATDPRFAITISNNSGCGGAALSRRAFGETVARINTVFPHWFCEKFSEYNGNENDCPVDQHMLIGLMAPRPVYVASASEDLWADPKGEFLAAKHAEEVYDLYGKEGLGVDEMPEAGSRVGGTIGYHLRAGKHNITAFDWKCFMDFADEKFGLKD